MRVSVKTVLPLILALLLSSSLVVAQKGGGGSGGGGGGGGSKGGGGSAPGMIPTSPPMYDPRSTEAWFDPYRQTTPGSPQQRLRNEEPSCFEWPMSPIVSGVVSVNRLDVPADAREIFSEACAAVVKKELSDAQHGLNRAVKIAPKFAPAWVLLGQIQKDAKKFDQAEQSCAQAHNADASYLPAYLCLADLAARQDGWARVMDLTSQALELHPVRSPGAYYLNALASFYLGQSAQAEKSALRALEDERSEHKPPLRWLLAKIYEAKGDRAAEAEQLREYLKTAPHAPDAPMARKILQQIESQETSPSSTSAKPPG